METQTKNTENSSVVDIIYLIDRSGSMVDLMSDAIGGFNTFVKDQQKESGECYLTLIAFDTSYDTIYDRVPIQEVTELSVDRIPPRGGTALNDAVGKALSSMPGYWNVIALIMTDGEENSSIEWTQEKVKELVQSRIKDGWEINFVGVGIDGFKQGHLMGLQAAQIRSVAKSKQGVDTYSGMFTNSVSTYRKSK